MSNQNLNNNHNNNNNNNNNSSSNPSSAQIKRKNSKNDLAFYETPSGVTTSSQIIKEAKEKLQNPKKISPSSSSNTITSNNSINSQTNNPPTNNLIRTVQTNRPFTPRDDKRSLFGTKSMRTLNERPPSSFSLGSKNFESVDPSRPPSGTRLSPIETRKVIEPPEPSRVVETQQDTTSEPTHPVLQLSRQNSKGRLLPQLNHATPSTNNSTSNNNDNHNNNKIASESSAKYDSQNAQLNTSTISSTIKHDKNDESKNSTNKSERKTSAGKSSAPADPEEEKYWNSTLKPLLDQMSTSYQNKSTDELRELCIQLYKILEAKRMFGKASSKRSTILKIIYKFFDVDSDVVKIKLARVVFAFEVTSDNLTNICRLVFSLSKKEGNDPLFLEDNILDLILNSAERLDFHSNSDSIVYFCGALKNLSGNTKILKELSNRNLVKILSNLLKTLSQFYKDTEAKKSEAGHALVQLTATLRTLADVPHNREKFINCQIIEELSNVLKYYTSDSDLMLNISRILSKLTLHSDCCAILTNCQSCYKSFIKVMIKHESKADLIVRIGFILGNLTSRYETARTRYGSEKYSIEALLKLLNTYLDIDQKNNESFMESKTQDETNEREPTESEDVMIKVIRVIANLSINETIGTQISNRDDCIEILMKILEIKDLRNEELVINTIVTLNNLTFYESQVIVKRSIDLVNSLMKYLLSNNYEAILEVFRVLANLTRHKQVRNYLVERKIDIFAVTLLDSGDHELVYIVIGVLINLMGDEEKRQTLKKENGIMKLAEVLNDFGREDWQLASMVCKLLMNYSEKIVSSNDCFGEKESQLLSNVLWELLDEELFNHHLKKKQSSSSNNEAENINEYMKSMWQEDFCPVGQRLLERLQSHQSQFEPL